MGAPWYLSGEFLYPVVLLAAAALAYGILEGAKRSFLRAKYDRRKDSKEDAEAYYSHMGRWWIGSIIFATLAAGAVGLADEVDASWILLAIIGAVGGVSSRPLHNKVITPLLDRAEKRAKGEEGKPLPRSRDGRRQDSSTWFGK